MFWKVPAPARGLPGAIRLTARSLVPAAFAATVDLALNGGPAKIIALPQGNAARVITLPVPAEASADGLVHLAVALHAASGPDRCRDARLGGAALQLGTSSALSIDVPASRITSVREALPLLPGDLAVALPPGPTSAPDYAALLKVFTALKADGHRVEATNDPQKANLILTTTAGIGETAAFRRQGLVLTLPLNGTTMTSWLAALAAHQAPAGSRETSEVPLGAFGGATGTMLADAPPSWTVSVPLRRAPLGRSPDGLALDLQTPEDIPGTTHLVHVFLNGNLVTSKQLRPRGHLHHVIVDLPEGQLALENEIRVTFERVARTPNCLGPPLALPVTLLPTSRILFRTPEAPPTQFHDLTAAFGKSVTVVVPPSHLAGARTTIDPLSDLLAGLEPAPWTFTLAVGPPTPAQLRTPFLVVADALPAGTRFPLQAMHGPAQIVARDGRTLYVIPDSRTPTIVRLASYQNSYGLWLRTSDGVVRSLDRPLVASAGDLLIADAARTDFFLTSTAKRGPTIRPATTSVALSVVRHYWKSVLAALWAGLTIMTAFGLWRERNRQ